MGGGDLTAQILVFVYPTEQNCVTKGDFELSFLSIGQGAQVVVKVGHDLA